MKINYFAGLNLKALIGFVVLALVSLVGSEGTSMAGDHDLIVEAQSVQSGDKLTASGTEKTNTAEQRRSSGVADKKPTGSGRLLTIRQKQLFVLGVGTSEKMQ